MNQKIMLGCAAALLSLTAMAQDEAAPSEADAVEFVAPAAPEGNAWTALENRWYITPSLSWVIADPGRQTDDGQAFALAIGRRFGESFTLEGFAQYSRFDHEQGSDSAELIGAGVNSLFFPTKKVPAYLLLGAGYGDVSSHPGGEESYGTLLLNVGGGYWWNPFDLLFKGVSLRTEAVWRLDAHNDSRTGAEVDNGRKDFGDLLLTVGLNIPVGDVPEPPAPPPEAPVEVVAAAVPSDADGDGVTDDLDQCPDTPAGTAVDASGCPAVVASTCKTPEPGEKLDLAGCATGDVIVLKGVNFDFNKDRLTSNAKTILDDVGEALKSSPATNVELGGHTDGKGSDTYNETLSERRACAVGRYLTRGGVDEGRMSPIGYGETKPIGDNETEEGREQNRRVELRILDSAGSGLDICSAAPGTMAAPIASESPAAEPAPEPAAPSTQEVTSDAASEPTPPSEPATEPAPAAVESTPPPEASAAPAAPAAAPTESMPAVSGDSMQLVPEGEVFGASAPDAGQKAPSTTMVPEGEVFGDTP